MFKNRFSENRVQNGLNRTPISRRTFKEDPFLSERKIALIGLVFSLTVILCKIFIGHYDTIQSIVFEKKLISYEVMSESGQIMFTNTWKTAVRFSNLWLPVICGLFATYFTWMCVYMDSNVPGILPPSPLSPQKYRTQSGRTFHLNYLFAILVGIAVTSYMLFRGTSIEY